ncbi:MAG: class II aldolase family protein [Bacteroidetes bacterium HGW-Bacteroidetes-9]|nr:MAG: class II aldolase family protein [Bacteroidetes bacterium HGW-Bacteroidetes-9]
MNERELDLFVYWAQEAVKSGLLKCSSGNLSNRLDDGTMLISGTGSWLGNIDRESIAQLNIESEDLTKTVKPSAEYRFHRQILRQRKDINTILHFQAPSATTIACMGIKPDYNVIIEVPIYIGHVGYVPFLPPGSAELADAVAKLALNADCIQLANHGQVVCGKDYKDAVQKAVFFELACSILLVSNFKAKTIPEENIALLREYTRKK